MAVINFSIKNLITDKDFIFNYKRNLIILFGSEFNELL
jgi:hypothetical protein